MMANPDTRQLAVVTGASSGIGYELGSLFSVVAEAGKVLPETVSARMHGQISQPGSAS